MAEIIYGNLLNGEFTRKAKSSAWFVDTFLESFDAGEYHALDSWLKPWQYKGLMRTAEINHWKMLSPKQWDVFRSNLTFNHATWEYFVAFRTATKEVHITISDTTGFVTMIIKERG